MKGWLRRKDMAGVQGKGWGARERLFSSSERERLGRKEKAGEQGKDWEEREWLGPFIN